MKFGKELLHAAASSKAEVDPTAWMDYKMLKGILKHDPLEIDSNSNEAQPPPPVSPRQHQSSSSAPRQTDRIRRSQAERRFFLALQGELNKVDKKYEEIRDRAASAAQAFLSEEERALFAFFARSPTALSTTTPAAARMSKCAAIHLDLVIVQNFGVLNYCGFKKILKKHDKVRAMTTRDSYMLRMVNGKSFARFHELSVWLERLEEYARVLSASVPPQQQPKGIVGGAGADRRKSLLSSTAASLAAMPPTASSSSMWSGELDLLEPKRTRLDAFSLPLSAAPSVSSVGTPLFYPQQPPPPPLQYAPPLHAQFPPSHFFTALAPPPPLLSHQHSPRLVVFPPPRYTPLSASSLLPPPSVIPPHPEGHVPARSRADSATTEFYL